MSDPNNNGKRTKAKVDDNNNDRDDHGKSEKRHRTQTRKFGTSQSNFDGFFDARNNVSLPSSSNTHAGQKEQSQDICSAEDQDILSSKSYGSKDILLMIAKMTETIKFLSDKVNSSTSKIDGMRNQTILRIDDESVDDEDLPHLNAFESFKLPLEENQQLERLESCLKHDKSFNVFFVS